jgi:hypothetical protein
MSLFASSSPAAALSLNSSASSSVEMMGVAVSDQNSDSIRYESISTDASDAEGRHSLSRHEHHHGGSSSSGGENDSTDTVSAAQAEAAADSLDMLPSRADEDGVDGGRGTGHSVQSRGRGRVLEICLHRTTVASSSSSSFLSFLPRGLLDRTRWRSRRRGGSLGSSDDAPPLSRFVHVLVPSISAVAHPFSVVQPPQFSFSSTFSSSSASSSSFVSDRNTADGTYCLYIRVQDSPSSWTHQLADSLERGDFDLADLAVANAAIDGGGQNDDGAAAEAAAEPVDRAASESIRELSSSLSSNSSKDAVCMSSYTTFLDGLSRFASETWHRNRSALAARCGGGSGDRSADDGLDSLGRESGGLASSASASSSSSSSWSSASSRLPRPLLLAVCGPFGAPEVDLARYDRVALIAGGVGVTALLPYWHHALLGLPAHVYAPTAAAAVDARSAMSVCADCGCGADEDGDDEEGGGRRRVVRRVSLVWCVWGFLVT